MENKKNNFEFIPYEQSLELKELGFDEICLGRWLVVSEWGKPTGDIKLQLGIQAEAYDKKQLPAPLYQQAFRWFREKYGHNGVIEGSKKFGFEWCIYRDEFEYIKTPNNSSTYEEAEDDCLIKLIEIVKTETYGKTDRS